jgi:hypothetical protein
LKKLFRFLFPALCVFAALDAREIRYPEGQGFVLDITQAPYNADTTGTEDVSLIIEEAVAAARNRAVPLVVYFPNGTYRISNPVVLEERTPGGQWIMLEGESRDGVVIRLDDNAPAFQNPLSPRAVISFFEGDWTNNAFTNLFKNFTVEVGAGNPGAIGVRFHGNNVARMENVRVVSMDPAGVGRIGVDLKPAVSSPGVIKRVEIDGFDIGFDLSNSGTTAYGWLLDEITVRNQHVAGIQTHRKGVSILNLYSVNTVPAVNSLFRDGMLTIIGADLRTPGGIAVQEAAVVGKGDFLYLRDAVTEGYSHAVNDNGQLIAPLQLGESYRNGPAYYTWGESLQDFSHLPIELTPEVPWDDPSEWAVVDPNAQGDDTEALQAALLSGARTVYLKPGFFNLTSSVRVGPNVQRIASNWARIQWSGGLFQSGKAIFYWEESNHDVVIFDRIAANWLQNTYEYMVHNASQADMVLRDVFWIGGGVYRNEPTSGRLFIDQASNVPGGQQFRPDLASYVIVNQHTWARQFNPEMALPMLVVDGGTFWVSGFKFGEQQGPTLVARNQAQVEMLGGFMNVTHGVDLVPADVPILDIDNARVSARMIERAGEIYGPPNWNFRHRNVAREVRDGVTRLLPTTDPMVVHRDTVSRNGPGMGGAMIPFYTSLYDPALYSANTAPSIEAGASRVATLGGGAVLAAVAVDHDGPAERPSTHWRTIAGPGAAYFDNAAAAVTRVWVTIPGVYTFVATASDGLLQSDSNPVSIEFTVSSMELLYDGVKLQRLTDLPPRDGKADSALPLIFLYTGDFSTSPTTQEQEIRLHMEQVIRPWAGRAHEIESAVLQLTPKSLRDPLDIELHRTLEKDYGLVSLEDFAADSVTLQTLPASTFIVNETMFLDVTDALVAALNEGRDALALQLRPAGGPNDNGASNYVEFHGFTQNFPQYNPRLIINVTDTGVPGFSDYIAELPSGLGWVSPVGYLVGAGDWWYSDGLQAWVHFHEPSQPDSIWMYLQALEWLWTNESIYPFVYDNLRSRWLFALEGEQAGWFYDLEINDWTWIRF